MNHKYQVLILFLGIMTTPLGWAEGNQVKQPVDTCIASLCLEKKDLTYQRLKKELGSGAPVTLRGDRKTLCFFDDQQALWLLLKFDTHSYYRQAALETIFVSTEQICTEKATPLATLKELKTNGGARVGMTETELLKLKGQPTRTVDSVKREMESQISYSDTLRAPRFGEKVFIYQEDRIQSNSFYISGGKVKSIWVSDAE